MIISLKHHTDFSILKLLDKNKNQIGSIVYSRHIHRFESLNDYQILVTENNTYNDDKVKELFDYYKTKEGQR